VRSAAPGDVDRTADREGGHLWLVSVVVGVGPGVQAVVKVLEVVRNWLAGRSSSTPPLQMTIGDKSITVVADKKQQDALVAAYVAALTSRDASEVGNPTE